ncbi:MAG: type IV toxin-antitoxin system AbiEi family antitoxin [Gammaproteobacteria bacterium]|nr:type IV toxin-antitoxin system AbiEi family antitoxin [Gammaproteobacteria bacterium]
MSGSPEAVMLSLSRLQRDGLIASPAQGFYVIVTPEYRALGCLPAEQFIPALMDHKGLTYYAGLLSAAQYYGAAHQRPQEFQVLLEKPRRSIRCGKVRVRFITRKQAAEVPVKEFNTPRGTIRVSTPEATALDLAGYPRHVGGFDQTATILAELADEIDGDLLPQAAMSAPIPWAQRLGFLLDQVSARALTDALSTYVSDHARDYTPLVPGGAGNIRRKDSRWKIRVNADVEPDD